MAVVALSASFSSLAVAQVYKYVDEQGNVSYASSVPAEVSNAERLAIEPAPSADAVAATRERFERLRDSARELEAARKKREAQAAEKRAERDTVFESRYQVNPPEPRYYYPYPVWPALRPPLRPRPPQRPPRPPPVSRPPPAYFPVR